MDFGNKNNSNSLLISIVVGGIFIVLGGLAIGALTPSIFPDQASAESEQIDTLFRFLLVIGGAIFLLVQGLLLYSIFAFRKREDDEEEDGPTVHGNTTLELVWTAIPAVIVLVLVIYSYQVWVDIREPNENETTISATGARFAWTFGYVDPQGRTLEGSEDVISGSLPDLHTYVGQHVVMSMQTQDVIHAFWIPEMRVKQDLLPGRTTEIRFTPIEPDEWDYTDEVSGTQYNQYRVVCTELCGSGHGNMWANVFVHESEEAYLTVLEREVFDPIINPPADPVILGRQVVQNYPCSGCHVLDDLGWSGVTGPTLNGVGDRAATRVAGETAEEYLYRSLHYPAEYLVPGYGALMPQFQPNDPAGANYMPVNDFYAIVSYLCTQTATGESNCDLDNLRNVINADNPDNQVTFGLNGGGDEEAASEAELTPEAESTADGAETTPEAEETPEVEGTPEAEGTPEPDASVGVGS